MIIDGREIEARPGAMLLPTALDNGISIPHYCWHRKLSIDGSCRMCQVKIEKVPKLAIACNTPVQDGMVVSTTAPEVLRARRGVMELLLLNHPLDCPICDQAGECKLQNYAYTHGSRVCRTDEPRRKLRKRVQIGPRVVFDQERCILCRRCVRFCNEVSKSGELRVHGHGDRSVIDVYPGRPLDNEYSICTADICPVGALLSREFHHRLRVWFLAETKSVCPSCANGCNIRICHHKNRVWRLLPRRNDHVNDTWMCDHGRLNIEFVNDPARLRRPLRRLNGALEEVDWDSTLRDVADALRRLVERHGAAALGVVASPHLTNEEIWRLRQLVRRLGTPHVDVAVRRGQWDDLLVKEEKAANARGCRTLGLTPSPGARDVQGILEGAAEGEIKGLFICGTDLWQVADRALVERAAAKVELLILLSLTAPPIPADFVVPALSFAEKEGTFTNFAGRVQRIHKAIDPGPGVPSEGEVFSRLLQRLTGNPVTFEPEAVFGEIAGAVGPFRGLTYEALGDQGARLGES